MRRRPAGGLGLLTAAAVAVLFSLLPALPAEAASAVEVRASVNGRALADSSDTEPIRLEPDRLGTLEVAITNRGDADVTVRTVRLEGRVMGLTFFSYDTFVGIDVPAGSNVTRRLELDLGALEGQAIGLIPSAVKLLDREREELGSEGFIADVRGSMISVYGLFGLSLLALTVLTLLTGLWALARHTLSPNRWVRGFRFLIPGLGAGLVGVFTVSALRIFAPRAAQWVPIMVVCAVLFFALGYFSPGPGDEEDDEAGAEPPPTGRETVQRPVLPS